MKTIAFYSYKGGVGRSLTAANVACYLAMLDQNVVIIDFDIEAPGLHYKLISNEDLESSPLKGGLVDLIYDVAVHKNPKIDVNKYIKSLKFSGETSTAVKLLPAGKVPSKEYWSKLSNIDFSSFLYSDHGEGIDFFLSLKDKIEKEVCADFLIIDARTGVTEVGGVATTLLADTVVALMLNSREHLEGTRAVLHALKASKRPPNTSPMEIITVLSRLPEVDQSDDMLAVGEVLKFLNEELPDVESLKINNVFTLHADASLQKKERLLIGDIKSSEAKLFRDYLKLFVHMIPREIIEPRIGPIIERAKSAAFEDPDGAQKELENLAFSLNVPQALSALIKFYFLRNVQPTLIIKAADRLWGVSSKDSDLDLLWVTIKKFFKEQSPYGTAMFDLQLVEDVWRKVGQRDIDVGCDLAESYSNIKRNDRAVDILSELMQYSKSQVKVVSRAIRQFRRSGTFARAHQIISVYKEEFGTSDEFLAEWAQTELESNHAVSAELLSDSFIARLSHLNPGLASQILSRATKTEEAKNLLMNTLTDNLRRKDFSQIMRLGESFNEIGEYKLFDEKLKIELSENMYRKIVEELHPAIRRSSFRRTKAS